MVNQMVVLAQLESHLWESANILRGPVDAADFKTYIFPLLFFKRICDVWDEEYQEIVDETGDAATGLVSRVAPLPDPGGLPLERRARRGRATSARPCSARMREIEKANPDTLYGVFGDAQWTNKERLSDALLKDLIEHFSQLPLGNQNVASDLLGDAYEYLIKKFADATNKKAGEFYTPRSVVRLMIDMLDPQGGRDHLRPGLRHRRHAARRRRSTCKEQARRRQAPVGQALRPGEEPHHLLHRPHEPVPARHRGLPDRARRHPAQPGLLRRRPPGHLRLRHRQSAVLAGKVGRGAVDQRSLRPQLRRPAAVQSAATSPGCSTWSSRWPTVTGRMAVVLPQGALFRKGAEGSIRQKLLEMDLVEAVIGLAPNLFYGTGLAACILVLRKRKPGQRARRRC